MAVYDFYPRPPRGGRQRMERPDVPGQPFLSTPSARRATINIPAGSYAAGISIHALREEGDLLGQNGVILHAEFLSTPSARRATAEQPTAILCRLLFLSTPSARRATAHQQQRPGQGSISIHALREEGDHTTHGSAFSQRNFYPRPPRGGRRFFCAIIKSR